MNADIYHLQTQAFYFNFLHKLLYVHHVHMAVFLSFCHQSRIIFVSLQMVLQNKV